MPMTDKDHRPRVALLTLGCAKNLVDSERIASVLFEAGVEIVHEPDEADAAVVNTCGFIKPAKEESIDVILDVGALKAKGRLRTLVVTGCLSQRYGEELRDLLPEVDILTGVDPDGTARTVLRNLGIHQPSSARPHPQHRARLTPTAWSYLRISEGCDNRCAYCAIPLIRGPLRSRRMDEIVAEAGELVGSGARELNVIAQDTAGYGLDLDGRPRIHELIHELCRIDDLVWLRLLYLHPAHIHDELVDVMAAEPKVCAYADVPLQHVNNELLQRMGRRIDRAGIERVIARLRERIPDVTLRTTFMTGFPGESDAAFEELLGFVKEVRFDRVGCFAYSAEEGTAAFDMGDPVPEEVAEERRDRLMETQQTIAFDLATARVGECTTALLEDAPPTEDGQVPARSEHEAPDVDPVIYVAGGADLKPGTFVGVRITHAAGYDWLGEVRTEEQP